MCLNLCRCTGVGRYKWLPFRFRPRSPPVSETPVRNESGLRGWSHPPSPSRVPRPLILKIFPPFFFFSPSFFSFCRSSLPLVRAHPFRMPEERAGQRVPSLLPFHDLLGEPQLAEWPGAERRTCCVCTQWLRVDRIKRGWGLRSGEFVSGGGEEGGSNFGGSYLVGSLHMFRSVTSGRDTLLLCATTVTGDA